MGNTVYKDKLEWSWADERTFINQLGRKLISVTRELPDRFYSERPRLEQLKRYLHVCLTLRVTWGKLARKSRVIPYIEEAIEQEEQKEMEEEG